jgi:tRNA threonylcarbamoyladenosine biosynthesis protein TsaB
MASLLPQPLPLLALSASADRVSVAVGTGEIARPAFECWSEPPSQTGSDRMLANVDSLMRAHRLSPSLLGMVAVDVGPGPFTALRTACALAQGVSLGCSVGVTPVTSTEALAYQSAVGLGEGTHTVLVVIDARMHEFYAATVEVQVGHGGILQSLAESRRCVVCAAEQVWSAAGPGDSQVAGSPLVIAGNGFACSPELASIVRQLANDAGWVTMEHGDARSLRADSVGKVALHQWSKGFQMMKLEAVPRYVRDKVALDVQEQEAARRIKAGAGA